LVKLEITGVDAAAPQVTGTTYKIGTPPAAGTFANDVQVQLSVAVAGADGTADAAASITNLEVVVFKSGDAMPASNLELVTRLLAALDAACAPTPQPPPRCRTSASRARRSS